MNKTFRIDETVIVHGFDDTDRLASYRGVSGRTAFVHDLTSGTTGGMGIERLDHTSLWYAVTAAQAAGYDEVLLSRGWSPLEKWHAEYTQTTWERFGYDGTIPAIVDEVPPGRVARCWRVRNARAAYLAENDLNPNSE
jgi:hypothetical protein